MGHLAKTLGAAVGAHLLGKSDGGIASKASTNKGAYSGGNATRSAMM